MYFNNIWYILVQIHYLGKNWFVTENMGQNALDQSGYRTFKLTISLEQNE